MSGLQPRLRRHTDCLQELKEGEYLSPKITGQQKSGQSHSQNSFLFRARHYHTEYCYVDRFVTDRKQGVGALSIALQYRSTVKERLQSQSTGIHSIRKSMVCKCVCCKYKFGNLSKNILIYNIIINYYVCTSYYYYQL